MNPVPVVAAAVVVPLIVEVVGVTVAVPAPRSATPTTKPFGKFVDLRGSVTATALALLKTSRLHWSAIPMVYVVVVTTFATIAEIGHAADRDCARAGISGRRNSEAANRAPARNLGRMRGIAGFSVK